MGRPEEKWGRWERIGEVGARRVPGDQGRHNVQAIVQLQLLRWRLVGRLCSIFSQLCLYAAFLFALDVKGETLLTSKNDR